MHQHVLQVGSGGAAGGAGNRDMLPVRALSPRSSLSALWGGGTGEWSGQSRGWRPWESSLCAACPARASPHMPAMTAQLWENLSGLQGLGGAAREGCRAEPWPLLSASAVSPVGGNSEGCWSLRGAGGLLWEQRRVCHPTALPDHPSGERVGERCLFPSSVPPPPPV